LTFDIVRKEKGVEILLVLFSGAKCVREIQRAVGGGNKTIYARIEEFLDAGLVIQEYLKDETYGKKPFDRRLIRLTKEGKELAQSLIDSGFVKPLLLPKVRERWVIAVVNNLKVVSGKTRFMKILFLLKKESGLTERELRGFYQFRAGKYGPFSRGVEKDLEELQEYGFVKVEVKPVSTSEFNEEQGYLHIYELVPEKMDVVKETLNNLPRNTVQRLSNLESFNRMPLIELLRYVYVKYPDYIKNSLIVERVLRKWT